MCRWKHEIHKLEGQDNKQRRKTNTGGVTTYVIETVTSDTYRRRRSGRLRGPIAARLRLYTNRNIANECDAHARAANVSRGKELN